jgi:cell division protein FtsL
MITLRAPQRDRSAPVAEPRKRPHLRVVDRPAVEDDRDPSRRTASGVVSTLFVLLLFACIFGVVVFQVFLVQAQSHLDDLDAKISTQDQIAKQLRLDTAELESPDRILQDGKRLEMISPGAIGFLQPKPDDDANARFDPTKETVPVPTTVTPTTAYPGAKATTTPTTAAKTSPTTAKAPTTPVKPTATTVKPPATTIPTTTPTTTKPTATTTTAAPTR